VCVVCVACFAYVFMFCASFVDLQQCTYSKCKYSNLCLFSDRYEDIQWRYESHWKWTSPFDCSRSWHAWT